MCVRVCVCACMCVCVLWGVRVGWGGLRCVRVRVCACITSRQLLIHKQHLNRKRKEEQLTNARTWVFTQTASQPLRDSNSLCPHTNCPTSLTPHSAPSRPATCQQASSLPCPATCVHGQLSRVNRPAPGRRPEPGS